ncbi:MAG TPA: OmpA family protein [Spirochaetota bacterium]|nr:OmpA family protein [Spirochaetota bacterium]
MSKRIVYAFVILSLLLLPALTLYAGTPKAILDELDTCKTERNDLQAENSKLKSEKDSLSQKVRSLEVEKKKLESRIAELEAQISQKEGEVVAIEGEARDMMIVSKTVEEKIQEQEAEIAELRMETEEKEAAISQLRMEKEDLQADVRQINIEITQLKAENQKLERENEELEMTLAQYERIQRKAAGLMDMAIRRIHEVLREEIETGKVRVFKGSMGIVLDITGEDMFDMGSVKINSGGNVILSKVAVLLDELDGYLVGIVGNADSKPIVTPSLKKRFPTNWELSAHRGAVIVRHLLSKSSISPRRMVVMGLGEFQPIDTNKTVGGRGNNRRVDIVLLPIDILSAVVVGAQIK